MPGRERVVIDAAALIDLLQDPSGVGTRLQNLRFTAAALIVPETASAFREGELRGAPLVTADRRLASAPGLRCQVIVV